MNDTTKDKKIIYYASPAEAIEKLAYKTCKRLAEQEGKQCYSPEIIEDFTAFIRTTINIQVKHLNRQQKTDKRGQS